MQKELKFKILSEGQLEGVSATCTKYGISRTLYYRWLKNYKTKGMDGLETKKRDFIPANKTSVNIENALLGLIRDYPDYGPRALKYLFDDLGYDVSESAIYNIMKRYKLTHKKSRLLFSKKQDPKLTTSLPPIEDLCSGECWLFWINDYGTYEKVGHLFEYTLYDVKSRIACTRLYNSISFDHFEDLLAGVAMPVATTLHLGVHYLCFFKDTKLLKHSSKNAKVHLKRILMTHDFDFKVHILLSNNPDLQNLQALKATYTKGCLSFIMPLIKEGITFSELKIKFQHYLRHYNLNEVFYVEEHAYSPVSYHNHLTQTKLILPIWAYLDRHY